MHNDLSTCGLLSRAAQSSFFTLSPSSRHDSQLHCIVVNFLLLLLLLDAGVIANHYRIDPAARIPTLRFRTNARRPSPVLAASRQQPAANSITSAPTMASIFRRIYDWLLRLFWCVCLLPCACPCDPSMPVEPLISVHSCPFQPCKRTLHASNMTQEPC